MIDLWHIPNWSGDFKLEADGDKKSVLSVTDPTPAEQKQLADFLETARKKKWVGMLAGIAEEGESKLDVAAPISECGILLLSDGVKVDKAALTVIAATDGSVSALDGTGSSVIDAVVADDAEKAATTKRPTPCCPRPYLGPEERASEVLRQFSTTRQWQSWRQRGYMHCIGNLTGRLYRIAHRHSALAREQGRVAYDVAEHCVVHCHASQYPPSEEALAIKHCLEHREHWLRNRSGMFHSNAKDRYVDPFMTPERQGLDGVDDADATSHMGAFLKGFLPVFNGLKKAGF